MKIAYILLVFLLLFAALICYSACVVAGRADELEKERLMTQIKTFISTKAELLDEKVNKWLEENEDICWYEINSYMSYASIKDKGAYMIGCTIIFKKSSRNEHASL